VGGEARILVDVDAALAKDRGGARVHLVGDEDFDSVGHVHLVIPAKAGAWLLVLGWVPAFAGMTIRAQSPPTPSRATARASRCRRSPLLHRTICAGPAARRGRRSRRKPRLPARAACRSPSGGRGWRPRRIGRRTGGRPRCWIGSRDRP